MAKFIKDIVDLVEFLAGKNIATKFPPEKISLALYEVSLSLFTEYYDHYPKDQKIARFLDPFKVVSPTPIALTGGKADIPGDFEFVRFLDLPANQVNSAGDKYEEFQEVRLIEDFYWNNRINRRLGGIDKIPICRIDSDGMGLKLMVAPVTIAAVNLYYFKPPVKPVYAYTISGSRYVYDDTNSVDVEWSPLLLPQLKIKTLSALGINLREAEVISYTEQLKAQEGNK